MSSVCVAVLNHNGVRHLEVLLPSLRLACSESAIPARVLVLDNASTEGDLDWIRKSHPEVSAVAAPTNDFLFSYNWLLERLEDRWVVLLNNDLRVRQNFLAPLLRHLEAADVFSVSAASFDWVGVQLTSGPARLRYQNGFYDWPFEIARQETCHTLFTSGGFMAVDRQKFLALEGFCRLFHPAYCEDLDLCFRAWRRGWRCVYEPASVVFHREKGSWGTLPYPARINLGLRNSFLFQWASLPLERGRIERTAYILRILLTHTARLDTRWTSMWIWALSRWAARGRQFRNLKVDAAELASIVARINQPCPEPAPGRSLLRDHPLRE